ncbi:oligosaccaryltransferase [Colletotrichum camelliae]|nr:oligosaccaryltransferase [Colletotrichum camelliae]
MVNSSHFESEILSELTQGNSHPQKLPIFDVHPYCCRAADPSSTMISDNDLYRLAIFLGSAAMVLIILYHFVEVNSKENDKTQEKPAKVKGSS